MAGKTHETQKTKYLLGGESEAENERIEAEFFTDDDLFQELLTAEDDLIDAYARGELSASERKEFEKRFLKSSKSRERVYFARAFADASGPRTVAAPAPVVTPVEPGFFASLFAPGGIGKWAFAMIALAAFVGFTWLLVDRSRMNQELNALRAERERLNQQAQELQRAADVEKLKNAETLAQLKTLQEQVSAGANQNTQPAPERRNNPIDNNETVAIDRRPEPPPQEIVAFDVDPGSTRGGGGNTFTVARNVKSISLRLGLESESSRQDYRAQIETAEGRRVKTVDFKVTNVPHDRVAVPAIAANELRAGDYVMFLMGKQADGTFERVGSYSFRILRK